MKYNKLYIFVEGNDDELFFRKIILPLFLKHYSDVEIFKYAQWKHQKVELFLQSIITLDYDYIFTADIDMLDSVKGKKQVIRHKFGNLDNNKIAIVIKEIESWYLAGCTNEMSSILNIRVPSTTNDITKEDFNAICHQTYRSRIDFMFELLKVFNYSTAEERNDSFRFFLDIFNLEYDNKDKDKK